MANILLRSPQFKYAEIPILGINSASCEIRIDNIVRYTLVKNVKKNTTVNFEVAELCRDYLEIEYSSTYVPNTIDIRTTIKQFSGFNGEGSEDVTRRVVFDDVGFEGYGTYSEGSNPEIGTGRFLITINYQTDTYEINAPKSGGGLFFAGYVPAINTFDVLSVSTFGPTSAVIPAPPGGGSNYDSEISRVECTKWGYGRKIIFINRWGAQQDLWFYLRQDDEVTRANDKYNTSTLTYPDTNNPATYDLTDAPIKTFNTTAKKRFTLHSGYYPETMNCFFEELLLSEYVWIERPKATNPDSDEVVPVRVRKSQLKFKTSLNDMLVEYAFEFEEAFDYIQNLR